MAERPNISKRVRFEVFKRDNFKCQYCGKGAPEVVLHADHISPVSKGGESDIINLITACVDCNLGKAAVALSDSSAIQKQRAQLEELNERREQLEMLLQWREELAGLDEEELERIADAWAQGTPGFHLNPKGRDELRRLLKKWGIEKVLDAFKTAHEQYIRIDANGNASAESVDLAWQKVGGILRLSSLPEEKRQIYYVRGILRNRLGYVNERIAISIMEDAVDAGVDIETLKKLARDSRSWSEFQPWVSEITKDFITARSKQ